MDHYNQCTHAIESLLIFYLFMDEAKEQNHLYEHIEITINSYSHIISYKLQLNTHDLFFKILLQLYLLTVLLHLHNVLFIDMLQLIHSFLQLLTLMLSIPTEIDYMFLHLSSLLKFIPTFYIIFVWNFVGILVYK
jgi:hypothetical protein